MTETPDPLLSFSFYVELEDKIEAGFTACTGLNVRREVMTIQEGGINDYVRTLPGRVSFGNITLKQGIAFSDKLWTWFTTGFDYGKVQYCKVSIYQCLPYTTKVARQYDLEQAFPVAWTGPDLNTSSNEVAVESIEIAFTRFAVQNFNPPR